MSRTPIELNRMKLCVLTPDPMPSFQIEDVRAHDHVNARGAFQGPFSLARASRAKPYLRRGTVYRQARSPSSILTPQGSPPIHFHT